MRTSTVLMEEQLSECGGTCRPEADPGGLLGETDSGAARHDEESDAIPPDRAGDAGMTTVEYAIGMVVAAALAAVLYQIVTGDSVVSALTRLVTTAMDTAF